MNGSASLRAGVEVVSRTSGKMSSLERFEFRSMGRAEKKGQLNFHPKFDSPAPEVEWKAVPLRPKVPEYLFHIG